MPFSGFITQCSSAIIVLDRTGRIMFASKPLHHLLGYDPRDLPGASCFDLLMESDAMRIRLRYDQMVSRPGGNMHAVVQARHRNGATVWLELTAVNLLQLPAVQAVIVSICPFTGKVQSKDRSLSHKIAAAREEERANLAAELHDNVNQILAMSVVFVETAMRDETKRQRLLTESSAYLKSAMDEIRKLSYSLSGNDVAGLGLVPNIEKLAADMRIAASARVVVKIHPRMEFLLVPEQKLHLLRIVQEQMQNILKHARSSRILISFSMVKEFLVLRIKDNGRGFDVNAARAGIGISNMMHRARALNGRFYVESEPGKGSAVTVYLPAAVLFN